MDKLELRSHRLIASKYRLDRPLASGGMGAVWVAWNTQLDVPVAIKFMAPAMVGAAHLVARFEREAKAAAQLRSHNVVQIFEHGVEAGAPFIVMELLDGEDLSTRMRRERRLTIQATARIVSDVCKALRRAHAMGIVHRDLKPANIFLARDGNDEEVVKVLDFGVVKSLSEAVESGVTQTGELVGTPHYMSPEQARNTKGVDHRTDLWALAIIAYRAMTGSLPFAREVGIEVLMRVCSEPVPPPSSIVPSLGPEVDRFFAQALAIAPEKRFQSAREMADAINALAGFPVSSASGRPSSSPDDTVPPPSATYATKAYVYTSAVCAGDASSPSLAAVPAQDPQHDVGPPISHERTTPSARSTVPEPTPASALAPAEPAGPGAASPGGDAAARRSRPGRRRRKGGPSIVVQVVHPAAEPNADAASLSALQRSTDGERSPSGAGRAGSPSPLARRSQRWLLGVVAAVVSGLSVVGSAMLARGPASGANGAETPWGAPAIRPELTAAATEGPKLAPESPQEPPPAVVPAATVAPASTVAPAPTSQAAGASATEKPTSPPPSKKVTQKRRPPRPEGGIGKRPTY